MGMVVVFGLIAGIGWYVTVFRQANFSITEDSEEIIPSASPTPIPKTYQELPTTVIVLERGGQYFVEGLPGVYVVQAGDTLPRIAAAFYKSADNQIDIQQENDIATGSALTAGQRLVIPDVPTRLSREVIEREKNRAE